MMAVKKIYTKPCVIGREELKPDQAIAQCSKGKGKIKIVNGGYVCTWCGGSESKTVYSSKEEAEEAEMLIHNAVPHIQYYYKALVDGKLVAYYEDYNHDKVFDLNGGDNWQDVKDNIVYQGYYQS